MRLAVTVLACTCGSQRHRAHGLQADPAIALSTGCAFAADPALHESFSAVEPSAGFTIQARSHAPTPLEWLKLQMLLHWMRWAALGTKVAGHRAGMRGGRPPRATR